jgi:osmotically-inducible protein OsmY
VQAHQGHLDLQALGRTLSTVRETSAETAQAAQVRSALALSRRVAGLDLEVDVEGGKVILGGVVPSAEAAAIAEAIVADTSGVVEVENRLVVDAQAAASGYERTLLQRIADLETRVAIQERLAREPLLHGTELRVGVEDGRVVLEGMVEDESQRASAQSLAEAIAGADAVHVQIESRSAGGAERLAKRVEFELYAADAFAIDGMRIAADAGTVHLEGLVRSEAERLLAGRLAASVPGVREVVNDLRLRGEVL